MNLAFSTVLVLVGGTRPRPGGVFDDVPGLGFMRKIGGG